MTTFAHVVKGPRGMLAARSAPEIIAGNQDRAPRISGIVETLPGRRGIASNAPAQPSARDALQPFRGDNHVGVDILCTERIGAAFDSLDRFHQRSSSAP